MRGARRPRCPTQTVQACQAGTPNGDTYTLTVGGINLKAERQAHKILLFYVRQGLVAIVVDDAPRSNIRYSHKRNTDGICLLPLKRHSSSYPIPQLISRLLISRG